MSCRWCVGDCVLLVTITTAFKRLGSFFLLDRT